MVNGESAVGSWQLAVGSWQLAVGSWQLAVGLNFWRRKVINLKARETIRDSRLPIAD
jgi:hypothetical protein